ncbi:MAG: aldolase, partial [Deltaproteobacteria bacterium]|nr:aldolase [Deltaproteobacteria bacterium]
MIYNDYNALKDGISGTLAIEGVNVTVLDEETLRADLIDDLIFTAVFSPDTEAKEAARWLIRRAGAAL